MYVHHVNNDFEKINKRKIIPLKFCLLCGSKINKKVTFKKVDETSSTV